MSADLEALAKLREPFPPEAISKLPKGKGTGNQNQSCNVCDGWHKPGMIHLDYVGHAALTNRLLNVDSLWTWEPFATDEQGAPLLEREQGKPVGLWIRLTVAGMTRPGYGSCEPGKSDAVKELIGDALRNAAMRFGCALDLWHKGSLPDQEPVPVDMSAVEGAIVAAQDLGLDIDAGKVREYAGRSQSNADHAVAQLDARMKQDAGKVPA